MRRILSLISLLAIAQQASPQSATDHHIWQDARSFSPISRTATAITGEITLSGNHEFAVEGNAMRMTFGSGAAVDLTSVGASWRNWDVSNSAKQTAEVFRLSGDPGLLQNGNTLCGEDVQNQHLYAVFFQDALFDGTPSLNLAIFQSTEPPFNIESAGLCGTFTYAAAAVADDGVSPAASEKSSVESAGSGAWRLQAETNPIDDMKTVTISLVADTGTSRFGDPVILVARCKSNRTEAFVSWGDYLGNDSGDVTAEWKNVTVRVGAAEARAERWGLSTDGKATFTPRWAGHLLKELLNEDRLVVRTVPYGENPSTAVFNVSGLRSVLAELAATCNWRY